MKSVHLQQNLEQHLRQVGLKVSQPQVKNLALLSHSVAVSSNCHLSNTICRVKHREFTTRLL